MVRKINLQAGHQNAKNNCDPVLAKSTGAPGEAEFTVRVRDRLSAILLTKKNTDGTQAFQVQLTDSTYNCNPAADDQDHDLFLALHYDAYINNSIGGFADFPEPATDGATAESQRITKVINETYFPEAGIKYSNKSNANTRYYYMWKFLSARTPCVLLECGTGQNPHDKVILDDTDRVATAIARSICKAFNVPFDAPAPVPTPTDWKLKYEKEVKDHTATKEAFKFYREGETTRIFNATKPLQDKIDKAKVALS